MHIRIYLNYNRITQVFYLVVTKKIPKAKYLRDFIYIYKPNKIYKDIRLVSSIISTTSF